MSSLPGVVSNGPNQSNHLEKDSQVWERPWTLEEMRKTSASWSLAADSGLFLFLQDFSQKMLSKTHEIEKQLDGLIRDTKATDSCLHSVFNDFLMLSNTQFIENRVYDEEVEEPAPKAEVTEKQPEMDKTREQKEAELIPKMQEAVNFGLKVLDSAFEQLDIKAGNSDSEDEETTDRVEAILEPKDLYVDRPLPYLIGSQAFMEQDDVGLGDLSSDEMSIDSDRDSVIASEDGEDAVQSDEELDQDEGHGSIKKKPSVLNYEDDDEDDDDSDIFGDSDKEEEDDDDNGRPAKDLPSFADELAARIKGEPVGKTEGDRASLTSKKKSKDKKVAKAERPPAAVDDDSDDMFKPPKMEDEDFSPFGGRGGLFSGGKGLFDDDDEGDLFSETPKTASEDKPKTNGNTIGKPGKKIPPGGVSIFPDNSLFTTVNYSDSVESKENGTSIKPNSQRDPKQTPAGEAGGLFDQEDNEDDFFSGKTLIKSSSAGQDKAKPKNISKLFGEDNEDDEEGDIFRENSSTLASSQSRKEVVEEQAKPPEKKMPAGAISLFGPGTKTLLTEGLRKRQPSTSEESEKSEENGPPPVTRNTSTNQTPKPHTKGLFSDDEDTQIFPTIPKSQSKPEHISQAKISKVPTLFDDEDEEDLFAFATKSKPKPNQGKASTPQPKKTIASSLFSDDEDQWFNSKPSTGKTETPTGGMKSSASAPSDLPSAMAAEKAILFDNEDEDDLFATSKQLSQKKPQRVALLFEDEGGDDEDKPSLFGSSSAIAPPAKTSTVATPPVPSLFDPEQPAEAAVSKAMRQEQDKPAVKSPVNQLPSPPPEKTESKKKPVGAVSLFGGIDVLDKAQNTSALDTEDDFLSKESPPPLVTKKKEKVKANTLSLFDDDEENETDWNVPISITSKPASSNILKPAEQRPRTKSTGVFQDEELLFSQTQQKDNVPDVDIFATSGKSLTATANSVRPAAPSLFSEDDEDDLFSSVKSKPPPLKVAEKPSNSTNVASLTFSSTEVTPESEKPSSSPVQSKDPSTRIGKLKANPNLMINPSALLPGAAPRIPGALSVLPGLALGSSSGVSSSSLSPSPVTTPAGTGTEGGVHFDTPVHVTTLQSTNKHRTKGSTQRRPQSRAARQQAAQRSVEDTEGSQEGHRPGANPTWSGLDLPSPAQHSRVPARIKLSDTAAAIGAPPPQPLLSEASSIASVLTLPVSTMPGNKDFSKGKSNAQALPPSDEDLFGFDGLFGGSSEPKATTPSSRHATKTAQPKASSHVMVKSDSTLPSIFDDGGDDLFQKVKPRSAKNKAKASFMEEEEEDDVRNDDDDSVDIFGVKDSSIHTSTVGKDSKTSSSFAKQGIFQEEIATVPKAQKKHKEKLLDASLFDDNVDIFADLTATSKPKEKSKKKAESRSIFDDDMDDIFSSTVKPLKKAPLQSKKVAPSKDTGAAADSGSIFDDPLNALGGN